MKATYFDASASSVDSAEVRLSEFAVRELTETAAEPLTVDDPVVRRVRQVDVDASPLTLRHVVRHHAVFIHTHTHTSHYIHLPNNYTEYMHAERNLTKKEKKEICTNEQYHTVQLRIFHLSFDSDS